MDTAKLIDLKNNLESDWIVSSFTVSYSNCNYKSR